MSATSPLPTYRDAAVAAFLDGDYATALKYCRAGLAYLSFTPNATSGGDSTQWDRPSILGLMADCKRAQGAAAGIRITKLKHVAEADAGDYS